jgi:protein-S-isoprenylcysteine O-methyltransferase Ste14
MTGSQRQPVAKRRVLPPTYLLLSIVAMIALHFLLPCQRVVPFPRTLFGIVPFLIGVVLNLVADRAFKKHQTTVKPFEESTSLITSGVYAICRHPMYLGFVLLLLGIAVFMGSLTPFVVVPLFVILMEVVFIRLEERMMEAKFSEAWLAYKTTVRRWM